jgi:hypothetical protein
VAVTVEEAAIGGFGAHVLTMASDHGLIDAGPEAAHHAPAGRLPGPGQAEKQIEEALLSSLFLPYHSYLQTSLLYPFFFTSPLSPSSIHTSILIHLHLYLSLSPYFFSLYFSTLLITHHKNHLLNILLNSFFQPSHPSINLT